MDAKISIKVFYFKTTEHFSATFYNRLFFIVDTNVDF